MRPYIRGECVNCCEPVIDSYSVFCSKRCEQVAELVRHGRCKVAEGTFETPEAFLDIMNRLEVLSSGFFAPVTQSNSADEFTRDCLTIRVDRKLKSSDVIDVLADQFILRGVPRHIRSDTGPEFIAKPVQDWIAAVGAKTAYIELGSPWENGYCESFNSRLRNELLNREVFCTLREARVVIESWCLHYNAFRPHSSLGYRPPAPEAIIPSRPPAQLQSAPPSAPSLVIQPIPN